MDQSRYCLNSHVLSSSFGDSWEEQAFAEDAAGPLGGCIWPPRSYTCSFCRREFRSAQALGGHMNVHRRDRARLKQISGPNGNQIQVLLEPKPNTSLGTLQNPNLISNPNFDFGPTRPSTPSILRPLITCSLVQEQEKETPILSWNKSESRKRFLVSDLENQEKIFAGNLNSLLRKRYETQIVDDTNNDAHNSLILKRRRVDRDKDDVQPFVPKNSNRVNDDEVESRVPAKCSPNSTLENLDLELRLGT